MAVEKNKKLLHATIKKTKCNMVKKKLRKIKKYIKKRC